MAPTLRNREALADKSLSAQNSVDLDISHKNKTKAANAEKKSKRKSDAISYGGKRTSEPDQNNANPQAGSDKSKTDTNTAKKRKTSSPSSKSAGAATAKNKSQESDVNLSSIHLEGEDDDSVPVYETCDMVRRKIEAHLMKKPGATQAAFCRELSNQYHASSTSVSSKSLSNFRGQKGYDKGNTSSAFYAAYCYFEKLRIKEGKPKSKDRVKMEELWGEKGGFNISQASNQKRLWIGPGTRMKKNKYGEVTLHFANMGEQTGVL
ncbi:uncharacterized protein BDZ99DRAFT_575827 [Mytilinidion resinicola]|uniref:DUF7726 domain-containing protein n=1 Tax=Mytilinidion resinicola TaxID=574789 RepID=A0A6A6Y560_9PEZI|nr:uncharacterized protein BDZ99DRAFT_575827 [Mytilinidion resinicola]KAF2803759.1 hypothetical protein BDZ99DRAFT_575827 [Mytilinidion resinicola]